MLDRHRADAVAPPFDLADTDGPVHDPFATPDARSEGALLRVAAWLHASPSEVVGLAIMLVLGLVLTAAALASALARPEPVAPAALAGRAADDRDPAGDPLGAVTVHVTGAVVRPGVLALAAGARVADAVTAAGGVRADADLAQINLARPVNDGEQIWVPPVGAGAPDGASARDARVNINRATADELDALPGIGPARARAIVEHRRDHGPFVVPGDLRDIPGIGEATFQRLADQITVG